MSLHESINRTKSFVEQKKYFRFFHEGKPYQGDISEKGFKITRLSILRSSKLLIIQGNYKQVGAATTIQIRMTLSPFMISFIAILIGLVIYVLFSCLKALIMKDCAFDISILILIGSLLFLITLSLCSFWYEVRKQRRFLQSLFT